jgi:type III restriction enzyme
MNTKANYIKQRLSLREPLQEALDIVADLSAQLSLEKESDLPSAVEIVKQAYPSFKAFDRSFPSLCFSIATGVGKTRLMGACIAYLYLEKGFRNFFVLAPNLTIYDKLIEDFGNPAHPKYVFKGISELVHRQPVIITGDNYNSAGSLFSDDEIRINIFNISKFNRDAASPTRGKEKGALPRIKRLSEYLGKSYWDYLSSLQDLVVLMDEAHRYKADASAAAINELKPVLGIELTATPLDEKGNVFSNVVYEYNLAQALADGKYVKNPAIAYRSDFQTQGRSILEIEHVKLEDAVSLHEDVKTELEVFAANTGNKKVKPFILVVCRDISHAKDTLAYIQSSSFYNGAYASKVIQIDSSVNDEDNARLLETVEQYDNPVEIVIHVNMLAEGWDVTNLYTICPLRAADSIKLIEQTIGRGLRLPFNGQRVGLEKIDRLTVVAHDNFQKVIEAAQSPDSILKRFSFVKLDEGDPLEKTQSVVSKPKLQELQEKEQVRINQIQEPKQKQKEQNIHDARQAIIATLTGIGKMEGVSKIDDLNKPEIKQAVIDKLEEKLSTGQQNLFKDQIVEEAKAIYGQVLTQYKENIIEIPRIDLVQDDIRTWFEDFDLDTSTGFDIRILKEEIKVRGLVDDTITSIGVRHGAYVKDTPQNQIVSELINFPELDYDQNAALLYKLVGQALAKLSEGLNDAGELKTLVKQSRKIIAGRIWEQLKRHFRQSEPSYSQPDVLPFTAIEDWNFSALQNNGYYDFKYQAPAREVPRYVFMGFQKSGHARYKFDSNSEKQLAEILENDSTVLKWLRPAEKQFRIYWANNSRLYHPDFVVEREEAIYLVEVKAANQVDTGEVQSKKQAAESYCKYATEYNLKHGKKPWKYVIVPHDTIQPNFSFSHLLNTQYVG